MAYLPNRRSSSLCNIAARRSATAKQIGRRWAAVGHLSFGNVAARGPLDFAAVYRGRPITVRQGLAVHPQNNNQSNQPLPDWSFRRSSTPLCRVAAGGLVQWQLSRPAGAQCTRPRTRARTRGPYAARSLATRRRACAATFDAAAAARTRHPRCRARTAPSNRVNLTPIPRARQN